MDERRLLPERFVGYIRLVEACRAPGCPVCRCLRELTVRHLDTLLAEHVTDPTTRARLSESAGFCAEHAALLAAGRDVALGVGIVYHGLLGQVRAWLTQAQGRTVRRAGARPWQRFLSRRHPAAAGTPRLGTGRCPVCAALGDTERDYLRTVLAGIDDPELGRAYAESAGLCLPHLRLALACAPAHPGIAPLLARALEKVDRLADDLRRFIDKHDHRVPARFSDREAVSWTDALGFLAGEPELFGNEIPRSAPAPRGTRRAAEEDRGGTE